MVPLLEVFFFFNDTATTEIYTLSLHDALPISRARRRAPRRVERPHPRRLRHLRHRRGDPARLPGAHRQGEDGLLDRKSTRLNSSHSQISYAVFCLKKKKTRYCSVGTSASAACR